MLKPHSDLNSEIKITVKTFSRVHTSPVSVLFLFQTRGSLHCNKKWAKRSFPLENYPSEEGKFPCGYWNIFPVTHRVFIHSSVREKCSRLWTGTFYRSKKVNFLELSFLTDISGKFPQSVFLKDISGKFPHSCGKNVLGALPLPGSFLKKLTLSNKRLCSARDWGW